jgi:hypothetical protein
MKNIDIVCNDNVKEVSMQEAVNYLRMGCTIEIRLYNDKDQIIQWEKYNRCEGDNTCWSLKEIQEGKFFLLLNEGY